MKIHVVTNLENGDVVGLTTDFEEVVELREKLDHMDTRVQTVDLDLMPATLSIDLEDTPEPAVPAQPRALSVFVTSNTITMESNARPLSIDGKFMGVTPGRADYRIELTCMVEHQADLDAFQHAVMNGRMRILVDG